MSDVEAWEISYYSFNISPSSVLHFSMSDVQVLGDQLFLCLLAANVSRNHIHNEVKVLCKQSKKFLYRTNGPSRVFPTS